MPQTTTHGVEQLLIYGTGSTLSVWQQTTLGWWEALSVAANAATWSGVQTNDPRTPATTLIQPKLGVHLGTTIGQGAGNQSSIAAHLATFNSGMGRPAQIVEACLLNAFEYFATQPSTWSGNGDIWNWTAANGLALDGSMSPLFQCFFTDGETTDDDFAGWASGKYDANFTAALNAWKALTPNWKLWYFRFNQEFNTNTFGWRIPSASQVANWNAACKHVCNLIHTWGNANGIKCRTVWCPDTSYQTMETYTFSQPVINFFPVPDSNAVNGRYFDDIGFDNYMNGYGVNGASNLMAGFTTPLSTNTNWSIGTFVAMAQAYGCNIAISETGDGPSFDNNASATNGVMAAWATALNELATLTPPVAIEYVALWDITGGGGTQFSGGGNAAMLAGWKSCLGSGGNGSVPPIETIAPS